MSLGKGLRKELNFYRIHILFFTFVPLIASGVLYASNGQYPISYIDCLFLCVTSMTVCGLATVDLSQLTVWQQVIMFLLMCIGSPVAISWFIVYLRKYYFAEKFKHLVVMAGPDGDKNNSRIVQLPDDFQIPSVPWFRRLLLLFKPSPPSQTSSDTASDDGGPPTPKRLHTKMIRRMDDAPKRVDPSGIISTLTGENGQVPTISISEDKGERALIRRISDPGRPSRPASPESVSMQRYQTMASKNPDLSRNKTIEFSNIPHPRAQDGADYQRTDTHRSNLNRTSTQGVTLTLQPTNRTGGSLTTHMTNRTIGDLHATKHSGFGGFPMPHEIAHHLFRRFFPKLQQKLTRTVTVPITTTIASQHSEIPVGARPVPYISFAATVGRNSTFQELNDEQLDELGGVEYRALNALLWIVGGYHLVIQLGGFVIIAPYMSQARWKEPLSEPALIKDVYPAWYALFQVVSAYTNTGTSLVDQSMIPFQRAYPMIFVLIYLILAGNTAFPIFLRFTIWILTKLVPKASRANETLHFLLDHPRRCYIYLFPSHQTWFLATVVIALNLTDWFFFMVLDIGSHTIGQIPLPVRVLAGFLQAIAVRAAGFAIVPLAAVAPAVQMLYVIMMYISVYPLAMSVRSTNVYEEHSLGIFHDPDKPVTDDEKDERSFNPDRPRGKVWSEYLGMHAKKQLAFDMWWIALALFLVCIIERPNIDHEDSNAWFNIFTIVFELISAYGTVGLSLGLPTANYSLSGAFRPLSKLIVCVVMIRGRHRGLPVAIDRAVLLPAEYDKDGKDKRPDDSADEHTESYAFNTSSNNAKQPLHRTPTEDSSDLRQRPGHMHKASLDNFGLLVPMERLTKIQSGVEVV